MSSPHYNRDANGDEDLTARYLQQDTMGVQGNAVVSEVLTIFVMDSLPRFIPFGERFSTPSMPTHFKVKKALYDISAAHNIYEELPYYAS